MGGVTKGILIMVDGFSTTHEFEVNRFADHLLANIEASRALGDLPGVGSVVVGSDLMPKEQGVKDNTDEEIVIFFAEEPLNPDQETPKPNLTELNKAQFIRNIQHDLTYGKIVVCHRFFSDRLTDSSESDPEKLVEELLAPPLLQGVKIFLDYGYDTLTVKEKKFYDMVVDRVGNITVDNDLLVMKDVEENMYVISAAGGVSHQLVCDEVWRVVKEALTSRKKPDRAL